MFIIKQSLVSTLEVGILGKSDFLAALVRTELPDGALEAGGAA